MKTITKLIYTAFAVAVVALGALTATGAPADNPTVRPTPRPRPAGPPALFASVDGDFVYKYPPRGVQNTFAAGLNPARGVAFDCAGNLFVATFFCDLSCQAYIVEITP